MIIPEKQVFLVLLYLHQYYTINLRLSSNDLIQYWYVYLARSTSFLPVLRIDNLAGQSSLLFCSLSLFPIQRPLVLHFSTALQILFVVRMGVPDGKNRGFAQAWLGYWQPSRAAGSFEACGLSEGKFRRRKRGSSVFSSHFSALACKTKIRHLIPRQLRDLLILAKAI